jgi:hypothetical protein
MRKLTYVVTEGEESYSMEFITDRTPKWTEEQYMRHRKDCIMVLIDDLETNETEAKSYKLD